MERTDNNDMIYNSQGYKGNQIQETKESSKINYITINHSVKNW